MPDNCCMSVVQACADAQAVVQRARALFSTSGGVDVPSGADHLIGAAQGASSGEQRTAEMTGEGIPAYRDFVQRAVPPLATAAGSDTDLAGHITSAAAVDAAGATRLDTLAAQVKTLAADAPSATTANQQRAILTALRGQLQQASQVVQTTQQQGNSTAAAVRDLAYPKDAAAYRVTGVQSLDDKIVAGRPGGRAVFEAAGFGPGGAPLEPAPSPAPPPSEPGPTPFLPTWQQAMTAAPSPAPAPPVPLPAGGSPAPSPESFGDCFHDHMVPDLGEHMVSDGFADASTGMIGGAVAGAGLTPEGLGIGAVPGGVLGFVGGFAKGAFDAPIKAAGKGAADCLLEEAAH